VTGDLVYVYCVVRSSRRALAPGAPSLPGMSAPRALALGGGLSMVVADAPRALYRAEAIERRLRDLDWVAACGAAHEAVVEHAARSGTVVPLRLFTLFASEARASAHVAGQRERLDRVLDRLTGRQEWGLRVRLDPRGLAAARREAAAGAPRSGAEFLRGKQRARDAASRLVAHGRREVEDLFERLAALADDARRRPPVEVDGVRLLLDAAFLVARGRVAAFKTHARVAARRLQELGCAVALSGPWPAYHFVEPPA
jgi:hypothetical protein